MTDTSAAIVLDSLAGYCVGDQLWFHSGGITRKDEWGWPSGRVEIVQRIEDESVTVAWSPGSFGNVYTVRYLDAEQMAWATARIDQAIADGYLTDAEGYRFYVDGVELSRERGPERPGEPVGVEREVEADWQ